MPAESAPPIQLKHWFDEARYRKLAQLMQATAKSFDSKRFLQATLDGLDERSLMQRLHQTSLAFDQALPGSFSHKVEVLKAIAPAIEHSFVGIFLSDFVATFGLDSPDLSLDALRYFTCFGSAEFAIRPFIVRDLERTLAVMHQWTGDPNEHVRRLASEGSRPRLPWGLRLQALVADPQPAALILTALRDDPALYVRKSVANHLNDITKDHPLWVLNQLSEWDITSSTQRSWIAKQACRTLIKRGHPQALALFGFGKKPAITARFTLSPNSIHLGQSITLSAELTSTAATSTPQNLAIDYIVHYVRSGGSSTAKVFKWTELQLDSKASVQLTKKQTFRDFSTRRHYPGLHRIELQVNGHRIAETEFTLV